MDQHNLSAHTESTTLIIFMIKGLSILVLLSGLKGAIKGVCNVAVE